MVHDRTVPGRWGPRPQHLRRSTRGAFAVFCALLSAPLVSTQAHALGLEMPAPSRAAAEAHEAYATYGVAIGPYADGAVETISARGDVTHRAYRLADSRLTTLQILDPLRAQLVAAGFEVLFECETRDCGGFDFRYETDILPEPEMHVDLGDYRYLAAQRIGGEGREYIVLMVSRSNMAGFVQVTHVRPQGAAQPATVSVPSTKAIAPQAATGGAVASASASVIATLEAEGTTILPDLDFPSGSSELGGGEFESLAELAAFLTADPSRRVTLVGHTDAVGSLAANIRLSERRAASVMQRLVREYGVPAAQVAAKGVGFLAPRASNQTEDGRQANRRVEVVLTSVD